MAQEDSEATEEEIEAEYKKSQDASAALYGFCTLGGEKRYDIWFKEGCVEVDESGEEQKGDWTEGLYTQ